MKKRIFTLSIAFIFFTIGLYYLNYSASHTPSHVSSISINPLTLDKKKTTPINNIKNKKKKEQKKSNTHKNPSSDKINFAEVLFSPRDNIKDKIINYIDKEQSEILCAIFRLTDKQIAEAFQRAHQRGVKVTIIVDKEGLSGAYSKALPLLKNGIPIYVYPPIDNIDSKIKTSLMHNKILLLKGQNIFITGSFNYTQAAQKKNKENIIAINQNELYNEYLQEFNLLISESSKININTKFST